MSPRLRRFWLAYADWYVTVGRVEITLPRWPWRLYCAARGHQVVNDQCRRPEHRFCGVCSAATLRAALHRV